MSGTFLKTLTGVVLAALFIPPLAEVPTPTLERLRSLRWEAGDAYGGGRRCIAASQSKGNDEANGEPDTRGRLREASGSNGVGGMDGCGKRVVTGHIIFASAAFRTS